MLCSSSTDVEYAYGLRQGIQGKLGILCNLPTKERISLEWDSMLAEIIFILVVEFGRVLLTGWST